MTDANSLDPRGHLRAGNGFFQFEDFAGFETQRWDDWQGAVL